MDEAQRSRTGAASRNLCIRLRLCSWLKCYFFPLLEFSLTPLQFFRDLWSCLLDEPAHMDEGVAR